VDGKEYKYFDLPSLGPKYGKCMCENYVRKYVMVCHVVITGNRNELTAFAVKYF
jgi:hypothetical protein